MLLQSFQAKIKQSLKEARQKAWKRAYQADPKSEHYREALKKKNARHKKAERIEIQQSKAYFMQEQQRKEFDKEFQLMDLKEEEWKEVVREFQEQGIQLEEMQRDVQARQAMQTAAPTTAPDRVYQVL